MKMHIDTDVCTGHGVCEGIRPDIFEATAVCGLIVVITA